uniref:Origin recognition complex subunit 4 n=1 Tax=Phallusia mammillata TaxID=59560 RepID=A0A6F9DMB6_9ASCI|nr:origin recognition complex subunit 4 [Phallusia mammillata]
MSKMDKTLLENAKSIIKERLCKSGYSHNVRADIDIAALDLGNLLQRTVEFGESNSVLVVGAKGSGKSTLINRVLEDIHNDSKNAKNLLIVKLNGYLQTDDRIALAEITRQLKLENTIGDKVFGSFAETLAFLLEALRSGDMSKSQPIIIILEEFDLFAQHKNQTLLYNLFDIAQAGTTPLAVIGITCRLDVMELLEKRVKSRFSHRQIYICNPSTLENYVQQFTDVLLLDKAFGKTAKHKAFVKKWNSHVENLTKNSSVLEILHKQFNYCKEASPLHQILFLPVCSLSQEHQEITPADIAESSQLIFNDSKANILHGVSVLELCLIIAMSHLTNIYEGEPFNFQMVYNEFLKFSQKKSHILQNYTKPVVLKAFEHLIELELLKTKDHFMTHSGKLQKEYRPMILLVDHSQLREAVAKYPGCPTDVKQWAESSIV